MYTVNNNQFGNKLNFEFLKEARDYIIDSKQQLVAYITNSKGTKIPL